MDPCEIIRRCAFLEQHHDAHRLLQPWMEAAGLTTRVDDWGNLRGVYGKGPRLLIGSHVRGLGALIGIALASPCLPCSIEVVAFTEGEPTVDPAVKGYLEFQVEHGPVLDSLDLPLGVVDSVTGISRWELTFSGRSDHAGATPMDGRKDALAGAAEWIGLVEHFASNTPGLVATVGDLSVDPGTPHVIPGLVNATLDVRHAVDEFRERAVTVLLDGAEQIAQQRGLTVEGDSRLEQRARPLHFDWLEHAVASSGYPVHRLAAAQSTTMELSLASSLLLMRQPATDGDIEAALAVGSQLVRTWNPK